MRVAALYDVHGNFPALNAVLTEVDTLGVDAIVIGGDVASGPMPVEALDALRARGAHFIRGNADRVLDLRGATDQESWVRARRWVASRLGAERLAFLAALPLDLTLELAGLGTGKARLIRPLSARRACVAPGRPVPRGAARGGSR